MNIQQLTDLENALLAAGLIVDRIECGRLVRCKTTEDKGQKRSGWYRVFDGAVIVATFGDWRTGNKGVWVAGGDVSLTDRQAIEALTRQAKAERLAEQERQYQANAERLEILLQECKPIQPGGAVAQYLNGRGIPLPNTNALMQHDRLPYWEGAKVLGYYPAMIAKVTDAAGRLVNLHRTYLTPDGKKADVPIVKKLCGSAGSMAGASIKLGEPVLNKRGEMILGVAEGIETALAASCLFGVPVWAAVSAHGLKSFTPPPKVQHVYLLADNDESGVGQKAADDCGKRLIREGFSAGLVIPDSVGDWNDELLARRAGV